jgi:ribonuclease P protein component
MIAAKYRFHGYGALKFLFGHGKTYRFKNFSLRVAKNTRREHSRAAVVISKKVLKAAPKRNQVRRRIYEALRAAWPHIAPGHDLLISVYDPNILEVTHDQLAQELHDALRQAHLLVGAPTQKS